MIDSYVTYWERLMSTCGPLYLFQGTSIPLHHNSAGLTKSVDFETGLFLFNFVTYYKPKVIVELGTFRGYSTSWLILGTLKNHYGHVYAFEVFKEGAYGGMWYDLLELPKECFTYNEIPGGIWHFEDHVPDTIDFIFHDTEHLPGPTEKELTLLCPRVSPGGVMVFDDIFYPGYEPMASVIEKYFEAQSAEWHYETVRIGHGLGVAKKL